MTDTSVITNEQGALIAVVINNTRFSPEAITMTCAQLEESRRNAELWKEAAAEALNGQDILRRKLHEARETAEQYAARIADAEQAMALMVDDMLKRGETAEAIGRVMRYARDYVSLRTDTAFDGLVRSLAEYDELRKRHATA